MREGDEGGVGGRELVGVGGVFTHRLLSPLHAHTTSINPTPLFFLLWLLLAKRPSIQVLEAAAALGRSVRGGARGVNHLQQQQHSVGGLMLPVLIKAVK